MLYNHEIKKKSMMKKLIFTVILICAEITEVHAQAPVWVADAFDLSILNSSPYHDHVAFAGIAGVAGVDRRWTIVISRHSRSLWHPPGRMYFYHADHGEIAALFKDGAGNAHWSTIQTGLRYVMHATTDGIGTSAARLIVTGVRQNGQSAVVSALLSSSVQTFELLPDDS